MLLNYLLLSRREKLLRIRALVSLAAAVLCVRLNLVTLPNASASSSAAPEGEPAVVAATVRAVRGVARYLPGASCLPQAIAVHRLLAADGIPTAIRLGVRKCAAALEAHAWVEHDGRPVTDPPTVQDEFTVLTP